MLNNDQILENKKRFISLLKEIKREGSDIDNLINKLDRSDFFTAPASTQYHLAFEGGLCQHSLNVYDELSNLIKEQYKDKECPYSNEQIIIISLLHDFSKMNFYETSYRNVKDDAGNWNKVPFIKVKEMQDRFIYSHHGANSEYMVGRFIPLNIEESVAIIHHMGWSDQHADAKIISEIYNKYPLALYLHLADCLATFIKERI